MNKKAYRQFIIMMLSVVFFVAVMITTTAFGQESSGEDVAAKTNDMSTLAYLALSAVIPIFASVLANFFKINDKDSKWMKVVKKTVNVLALNISKNAGQ